MEKKTHCTKGKPHICEPPDDRREWMLLSEAAALLGVSRRMVQRLSIEQKWQRFRQGSSQAWLRKPDILLWQEYREYREKWYKRRRPQCWEPMIGSYEGASEAYMQRIFWTTAQAAAFLGITKRSVLRRANTGRIPVFLTHKPGGGAKNWYSPTSLRNLKEDEQYLKWRAVYEKGKATRQAGIVEQQAYKQKHQPLAPKNLPPGCWLTVREAADLLAISRGRVLRLLKRDEIFARHLGGLDKRQSPWIIDKRSLEYYTQSEAYRANHRRGQEAAAKAMGKADASDVLNQGRGNRDFPELAPAYSYDELMANRERVTSLVDAPPIW